MFTRARNHSLFRARLIQSPLILSSHTQLFPKVMVARNSFRSTWITRFVVTWNWHLRWENTEDSEQEKITVSVRMRKDKKKKLTSIGKQVFVKVFNYTVAKERRSLTSSWVQRKTIKPSKEEQTLLLCRLSATKNAPVMRTALGSAC